MSAITKLSNLQQRIIAGLSGVAVMLIAITLNEWGFFIIFFIICLFTQWEFYKLVGLDGNEPLKIFGTASGLIIYTLVFLTEKKIIPFNFFFLIPPVLSFVFFIKLYKKTDKKPFTNIALTFLGIIYTAVPFSLNILVAFYRGKYSWQIAIGCLLLLWASDTGAYFAGKFFGKKQLFARVSPKKTWEGTLGGLSLSLIIASILSFYFKDLQNWQWYCVCLLIVVAGTYGDLVESLLKRSIEIKDSGSIIPGHGGFLDRFDGLLLSAPFVLAFLKIFE